jgi:hypothetical protein
VQCHSAEGSSFGHVGLVKVALKEGVDDSGDCAERGSLTVGKLSEAKQRVCMFAACGPNGYRCHGGVYWWRS